MRRSGRSTCRQAVGVIEQVDAFLDEDIDELGKMFSARRLSLLDTSVDEQLCSIHEAAVVRRQEGDDLRDFTRFTNTSHWYSRGHR